MTIPTNKHAQRNIFKFAIAAGFASMAFSPAFAQQAATKDQAKAVYKVEMEACDPLSGNAKDICKKTAEGRRDVAVAEMKNRQERSERSAYHLAKTRADADYAVAKEVCDDQSGNAKDVCEKQAKANHVAAIQASKFVKKADNALVGAVEKTSEAQYKVEVEKCDALSGSAKSTCKDQAKASYKP